MKKIFFVFITLTSIKVFSLSVKAQNLNNAINTVSSYVNGQGVKVTNDEIVKGLKEALSLGAQNASSKASALDGFNKNNLIRIPFPPEAKEMENKLRSIGMGKQVDEFTTQLNRAAERAAKEAAPIFINAITSMSLADGISIIKGGDNAATNYLQDKTSADLKAKFKPIIQKSLNEVQITRYWNPLATQYNRLPLSKKLNPNLEEYVTLKALEGLFKLIGQEELKIRKDPASRISDLLKKVFG
jgi:hypothetical protein